MEKTKVTANEYIAKKLYDKYFSDLDNEIPACVLAYSRLVLRKLYNMSKKRDVAIVDKKNGYYIHADISVENDIWTRLINLIKVKYKYAFLDPNAFVDFWYENYKKDHKYAFETIPKEHVEYSENGYKSM